MDELKSSREKYAAMRGFYESKLYEMEAAVQERENEREACAKEAENEWNYDSTECGIDVANDIAAAIRARGKE